MVDRVDFQFIGALEGGSHTKGYVPALGTSKSGVTIATGFDLGQRDEGDLRRLRLGPELIAVMTPYLGAKGTGALKLIQQRPLIITPRQAQAVDRAVKSDHLRRLRVKYDAAGNSKRFVEIPWQAQTVIASVSFQYGIGLDSRTPQFWKAVTEQNWPEAAKILRSFGDLYPTRRRKEASLMETIQ